MCYSIFSFICMLCRSLFVLLYFFLLAIVLSALLLYTDSDYAFGIFKLFSSVCTSQLETVCTMFILSHHLCRFDLQKTLLFTTVSIFDWIPKHRHVTSFQLWGTYRREEFEDTKCVIRIRWSLLWGTAYPSGAPESPPVVCEVCYSIFSFICMLCRSLFVLLYFFLLAIVLSALLRYTDSDYREVIIGNVGSNWFNMYHI
jgi:hypothetical protein